MMRMYRLQWLRLVALRRRNGSRDVRHGRSFKKLPLRRRVQINGVYVIKIRDVLQNLLEIDFIRYRECKYYKVFGRQKKLHALFRKIPCGHETSYSANTY